MTVVGGAVKCISNSLSNLRNSLSSTSPALVSLLGLSCVLHVADFALAVRFVHICGIRPVLRKLWRRVLGNSDAPVTPSAQVREFLNEHVHHATVTTRDMDLMFHMNNARYCREADFARHELFVACGLFDACWRRQTPLVTAAQSIRYRRELPVGAPFQIRTRVVGWDASSIVLEQVFCTTSRSAPHSLIVHAVLLVKEAVSAGRRKAEFPEPLTSVFAQLGWLQFPVASVAASSRELSYTSSDLLEKEKAPPADVVAWIVELNETSSRVVARFQGLSS